MACRENIEKILAEYNPIGLSDLEEMKLLDRFDTKYVFNTEIIPEMLDELKDDYDVLHVKDKRCFQYDNQYYDTEDLFLHRMHVNGKAARYKIRARHYVDADISFFELKTKSNKGLTEKYRIKIPGLNGHLRPDEMQLLKNHDIDPENIVPGLKVRYRRITLLNKRDNEKITFDFDLEFESSEKNMSLSELAIAEVKISKNSVNTTFRKLMIKHGIREESVSKYCTGNILTVPNIKYNRYKSKMLMINKICNGGNGNPIWY